MISFLRIRRTGPIGVDIGSTAVKLLQLGSNRQQVVESVCWELPRGDDGLPIQSEEAILQTLCRAREARSFRGREAVFSLSSEQLCVQNLRLAQGSSEPLEKLVCSEAASRLPFDTSEAEIRFVETETVRQGDALRLEVIVLACRRAVIEQTIALAEKAGLIPVGLEPQPIALLRCYGKQYRRESDQQRRVMYVNVGGSTTTVLIAQGNDLMFIKALDLGGRHLDGAVAQHLGMKPAEASALRRHHGDRRADQRDPEITRALQEAVRPVWERLTNELTMCIRYFSVTFRGQPLSCIVLGGGEATQSLAEWLSNQLNLPCELGEPFRSFENRTPVNRPGQWDVVTGLALYEPSA